LQPGTEQIKALFVKICNKSVFIFPFLQIKVKQKRFSCKIFAGANNFAYLCSIKQIIQVTNFKK
jgi:hypothetical protein